MKQTDIKNLPINFCSKKSCVWFDDKIPIHTKINEKIHQLARLMEKQEFWKSLDQFKNKHKLKDDYNQKLLNWLELKIKKLNKQLKIQESIAKTQQLINLVGENQFWKMLASWKEIQKEKYPKLKKLTDEMAINWLDKKLEIYKNKKS